MDQIQGGYESKVFVRAPNDLFMCAVCRLFVREPHQCKNGHIFCISCITKHIRRKKDCPTCRCDLNLETLSKNLIVKLILNDSSTLCSSNDTPDPNTLLPSCSWIGPLSSRVAHFVNECDHFPIRCTHDSCVKFLHRGTIADHQLQCEHRPESCPFCNLNHPRSCMKDHLLVCDLREVSCSNYCGKRMPFNTLHQHKATDCALETLDCPLFAIGICNETCPRSLARKDINLHISQLAPDRILLLAEKCCGVQRQNEELRQSLIREQNISEDMLKNVEVIVKFAGERDCDGIYKFKHLKNNAGVFERRGLLRGVSSRFVIHKVMLAPNIACWFLSILPRRSELTDCLNIRWYKSEAIGTKDSLPNNYWENGLTTMPSKPPRVTVRFVNFFNYEDEEEDEDEDDIIYMVDSRVSGDEEEMDEGEEEEEGDDQMV